MVDLSAPSHSALRSFCVRPNVRFEFQQANETLILLLRAHPFTQIWWIVNGLLFLFVLVGVNFLFPLFLNIAEIVFLNLFFSFIIVSYLFINFLNWYFNVGIVTNQRIVDIDFSAIVYRVVTDAKLGKIEDLTSKSGGFLESFFDYGNLFIQTAGEEQNIEFVDIPKPGEAISIINSLLPA